MIEARRSRLLAAAVALLLPCFLLIGCPPRSEPQEVVDLIEAFPTAVLSSETGFVDFGTSEGGSHLVAGWSWKERSADGTTFVWSSAAESIIEFFVARPRDLDVSLRCQSFPFDGGELQRLAADIDGIRVADIELDTGWRDIAFQVPETSLQAGLNQLRFRFSRVAEVGRGRSVRQLAVAFDWMRLGPERALDDRRQPPASVVDGALTLINGTRLDYFLRVPADSMLDVGEVVVEGDIDLSIELEEDLGDRRQIALLDRGVGETRWPLSSRSGAVRLRFAVSGETHGKDAGSARMLQPRILTWTGRLNGGRSSAAGGLEVESGSEGESRRRPDVVLYVVDTLRADHLGPYGHSGGISPEIDAFAEQGVTFEKTIAQAPWTLPSMASIFTGLTPKTHGTTTKESRLPGDVETIASVLQASGYATGGVVSNGFVSDAFGFSRGFDSFELITNLGTRAEEVLAGAGRWLDSVEANRPVFLYLHSIDPHDSYDPPGRFRPPGSLSDRGGEIGTRDAMKRLKEARTEPPPELVEQLLDLYGGEVAYSDWAFGQFLENLRERGRYDSALVVFISDHGEEFFEHGGWLHGHSLHAEVIDVPLIIKFPHRRFAGSRVASSVRQIDLLPTLIDYLGLPPVEDLEGRSLLPLISVQSPAGEASGSAPAFSYMENRAVSVVVDGWKLIARPTGNKLRRRQLYDLTRDPGETVDLAAERPILAGYLSSIITESSLRRRREVERQRSVLDPEMVRHLEALGYVD